MDPKLKGTYLHNIILNIPTTAYTHRARAHRRVVTCRPPAARSGGHDLAEPPTNVPKTFKTKRTQYGTRVHNNNNDNNF